METKFAGGGVMDLGIIGGGPAGSAAAIEAARSGLRVVVWDRTRFPRDKVCGEFLSPEVIPLLEKLIPAALSQAAPIRRAEFHSKRGRCISIAFPAPGAGLSRFVLDGALWRAAAAAGAVCQEVERVDRVRSLGFTDERVPKWEVGSASGGSVGVRALLLACGRWWNVPGLPSPVLSFSAKRRRAGGWVGAKAHFAGIEPRDAVEMYFFRGGYCGLAPVEGGIYNACFLVHRTLARSRSGGGIADFRAWINHLARHAGLAARLRSGLQVSETIATAPVCPSRRSPEVEGALVAGDAAGFLDPFTGDGISIALHSGQLAARELLLGWRGTAHFKPAREYEHRLARSVRRSYLCAALLRTLVRAPAEVQGWFAAAMPSWVCAKLLAETRWHAWAA